VGKSDTKRLIQILNLAGYAAKSLTLFINSITSCLHYKAISPHHELQ